MAIPVVCPGCKKSFNVSDKFAGKQGPCPQCKTIIQVPAKGEEIVVHAPEGFGPKDTKGRAVLKPIARKETKVSPRLTAIILGAIVVVLGVAWMFRSPTGDVPTLLLVFGALALAPPLAWAGYTFLRDDELEPFRGRELWLRVGICSAVYATRVPPQPPPQTPRVADPQVNGRQPSRVALAAFHGPLKRV
jgi:hypothetical protein